MYKEEVKEIILGRRKLYITMFEVGKVYEIRIGDVVSFNCVVLDFDENNGLLKISQNGKI